MNLGHSQEIWICRHWRHWPALGNDDHLKARLKLGELLKCGTSHIHPTPLLPFQPWGGVQVGISPALDRPSSCHTCRHCALPEHLGPALHSCHTWGCQGPHLQQGSHSSTVPLWDLPTAPQGPCPHSVSLQCPGPGLRPAMAQSRMCPSPGMWGSWCLSPGSH